MPKVNTPMAPIYAINKPFYDVADYGNLPSSGVPNGVASNSAMIIAAANAALAAGGGVVFLGEGTWRGKGLPLYANVYYLGAGKNATTIKLEDGANTDLFSAQTSLINLSASFGSGVLGTLGNFGFANMTLDGNKVNQTAGTSYPLRFYGYKFLLRDVEIINGYSGSALIDWNGTLTGGMEALIDNVEFHDSNGIGLQMGGPHDSRLVDCFSYTNTSHGFHFAPNAKGTLCERVHPYHLSSGTGAVGFLIEADGVNLMECECEGSDSVEVVMLGVDCSLMGGQVFSNPVANVVGIQLGQNAGQTPIPGQILQSGGVTTAFTTSRANINTKILNCQSGAVDFQNEGGNTVFANIWQTAGTALKSNRFPAALDNIWWNVRGLTTDNTLNTSSALRMGSSNNNAFLFTDANGVDRFDLDLSSTGLLNLVNGAAIQGYSDEYSTFKFLLSAATGNFSTRGKMAVQESINNTIALLMTTGADATSGIVIYAHSVTQSAPLLAIQDSTFVNQFTVAGTGAMQLQNHSTFFSGSGVPSAGTGANGDFYFRSDTPGTANQRIYVRSAGAWVGIV